MYTIQLDRYLSFQTPEDRLNLIKNLRAAFTFYGWTMKQATEFVDGDETILNCSKADCVNVVRAIQDIEAVKINEAKILTEGFDMPEDECDADFDLEDDLLVILKKLVAAKRYDASRLILDLLAQLRHL